MDVEKQPAWNMQKCKCTLCKFNKFVCRIRESFDDVGAWKYFILSSSFAVSQFSMNFFMNFSFHLKLV